MTSSLVASRACCSGPTRRLLNLSEDSLELHFDDHRFFTELLGQHDGHIRTIEQGLGVRIGVNGSTLKISGGHAEQALAGKLLGELYDLLKRGYPIYNGDVEYAIRILRADRNVDLKDIFLDTGLRLREQADHLAEEP